MTDTSIEQAVETEIKLGSLYNVILLNDHFTPFDFVIDILQKLFDKNFDEATLITQEIHEHDKGIAGTYSKEIAFQKYSETASLAKQYGHPLRVQVEPADDNE